MTEHIRLTIADLQAKLREQELAVTKTKTLINSLCEVAGLQPLYAAVSPETASAPLTIKSDQFYGQPLAGSIRQILEMRRALGQGPATVNEIYDALIAGGYAFDTKNEDYAKRGLRTSLSKNTVTFHRLPNGRYGLLEWYPNAKGPRKPRQLGDVESDSALEDQGLAQLGYEPPEDETIDSQGGDMTQ